MLMTGIFCHVLHLLLQESRMATDMRHLEVLTHAAPKVALVLMVCLNLPLLIFALVLLAYYYSRRHPWKSAGIVVGFEAEDKWSPNGMNMFNPFMLQFYSSTFSSQNSKLPPGMITVRGGRL